MTAIVHIHKIIAHPSECVSD